MVPQAAAQWRVQRCGPNGPALVRCRAAAARPYGMVKFGLRPNPLPTGWKVGLRLTRFVPKGDDNLGTVEI